MSIDLGYPPEAHEVRLMVNDPVACAWEWIKAYAANLSDRGYDDYDHTVTAEELIDTAMSNIDGSSVWGEYISKGGLLEGISVDPLFWDKLADLKQIEIPHEKRNNFFSCSC